MRETGKKYARTRISAAQTMELERAYATGRFPSDAARRELAARLGLTPRNVQVWFQNRRQRLRAPPDASLRIFAACTPAPDVDNDEDVSSIAVILHADVEAVRRRLRALLAMNLAGQA